MGDIIGPLLLITYINDVSKEIYVHINIIFFADDSKIISQFNDVLQPSLSKMNIWLDTRKLKLSIVCKYPQI